MSRVPRSPQRLKLYSCSGSAEKDNFCAVRSAENGVFFLPPPTSFSSTLSLLAHLCLQLKCLPQAAKQQPPVYQKSPTCVSCSTLVTLHPVAHKALMRSFEPSEGPTEQALVSLALTCTTGSLQSINRSLRKWSANFSTSKIMAESIGLTLRAMRAIL